ncbi:MAG TPA: DUF58 domain-containing protein [Firmicutes bacterium]|nr:DUF58 domain-containing protein [Bacillota bacterium]
MLSKEILKKIKGIQLKISHMSNEVISGSYISAFKGVGIEFNEVREYIPGDDVRAIDWNVTARAGTPFIKRYVEERELTIMLMVDLSGSQHFGTTDNLKSELAAEISALIAFLAIKNNDKVGLLIFSDTCEKYLPPQNGRLHVLRVIREILGFEASHTGTDIAGALSMVNKVLKHRSIIFLISDFRDNTFEKSIKSVASRHDLVAVNITDPRELDFPEVGVVELEDNETGEKVLFDTSSKSTRNEFHHSVMDRINQNAQMFKANKIDVIEIATDKSYLEPLQKFFIKRQHRNH